MLDEGGLLGSLREGAAYIDLSTNSPTLVRRLATDLAAKGITMLDAPVSGGVEGAEAGTLSIMVGGDEATFERLRPVLGKIGSKLFYCGGIGNGSVTKLCNNICSQVIGMISSEALTLGVKAGVDVKTLQEVISQSTGSSSRITARFPRYLLKRNFEPGFSIALSAKDTHLALDLAHELNVPMQAGEMAAPEPQACIERGWANMDIDILPTLQEERAGVQLGWRCRRQRSGDLQVARHHPVRARCNQIARTLRPPGDLKVASTVLPRMPCPHPAPQLRFATTTSRS